MEKSTSQKPASANGSANKTTDEKFLVVGIGASAGGVQALKNFFANVPADSGAAYVVILHLSPDHDSQLDNVLQAVAHVPVTKVSEKVPVEPNHVYVVSPNQSLKMFDGHIVVEQIHTIEERRAPVDIFFRTLAETHHARAVCVVLSGTGADGSMGLKRVKERGGVVFVQNPREAEFSDMPRNAIATDLVDAILNVTDIPQKIVAYRNNLGTVAIPVEPESRPETQQKALRDIFTQLRVRTGHDFSNYKRATVLRRIERRINVSQLPDLTSYAEYLRETREEAKSLLKDLLISVTNFFRDKEAFAFLETEIVPRLFDGKKSEDQVRVWVAGCATGEEAYTLAMLLAEKLDDVTDAPSIQIFASDIDEKAITTAREGLYTLNDVADVSPERLHRFFREEAGGFRIRRQLREMVLFANHNLIKDPPFSQLDLITCRNLLIYLDQTAQERVMETFHFSLKPGGYLFIGSSESVQSANDLFATVSKEHHVSQSRQATSRVLPTRGTTPLSVRFKMPPSAIKTGEMTEEREKRVLQCISFADLHQRLLEQYAPPSIVVNEEYEIVHLSERAGRFLQIAGGEPSNNLLKMIRPDLRLELRAALYQAAQKQTNVEAKNLAINVEGQAEIVNIQVRPVLRGDDTARGFMLVLFEKGAADAEPTEIVSTEPEPLARQLEEELMRVKAQLRAASEQHEIQAEELKASNEELQAMNEELRSAAEELETSKEELQSVNEELITVNQELKIKIEELSQSNNDFQNLINSSDIGTIFLDSNFRVKMFTPAAREVFSLIPADVGRPLSDIKSRIAADDDLISDVEKVLEKLRVVEREMMTDDGRAFLMQISPYRTAEDRINGVVISFVNITRRKEQEDQVAALASRVEQQSRVFNTALTSISDFAYIIDRDGRFVYSNQPLLDLLGVTAEEIVGKNFFDLNYPEELAARLQKQIQHIFDTGGTVVSETPFTSPAGSAGFYEYIFTPVFAADGKTVESVAGSTRDVTHRKRIENDLRESVEQYRIAVESAELGTWSWDLVADELRWNERHFLLFGMKPHDNPVEPADFFNHLYPADRERVQMEIETALREKTIFESEYRIARDDGEVCWMEGYGRVFEETDGKSVRIGGVVSDITSRRMASERLRESEERLRLLIESARDYAIISINTNGEIESWSAGAQQILGFSEAEAVGKYHGIIFTPEDRAAGAPEMELETARTVGIAEDERFHLRREGSRVYLSGVMRRILDEAGNLLGFVKIARDMTERIVSENLTREKESLQKTIGALEDERKRIARDLHDELGQQLTALRLKLETAKKMCNEQEICDKIDEIQLLAKQIDASVDFLAWELRPAALDDLGLIAALANYTREWSQHAEVASDFHASGLKRQRFAPAIETNLYRIAQEALNNVYKHAEAKKASVLLEKRGDAVVLIIEDDGKGFNVKSKANRAKGIGLIGMGERAAICGGTLEIESSPRKGTTIYVRVPFSTG
jgi:two-component system CheB/CheR fusion protein